MDGVSKLTRTLLLPASLFELRQRACGSKDGAARRFSYSFISLG
jgi:hypothetical protein